jgi:hypothetical protein
VAAIKESVQSSTTISAASRCAWNASSATPGL